MINLKYAELHSPLFIAGKNLQLKLDPTRQTGLSLAYDRPNGELLVDYNGTRAIVPISNVVSMVEGSPSLPSARDNKISGKPIKAQASVPPGLKND